MDQIKKFLEALKSDEQASAFLSGVKPEKEEECFQAYANAAKALGFSLTVDDLKAGFEALAQEQLAKTAQAEKDIDALSADELDKVAGGTDIPQKNDCKFSFKHEENCWVMDGCDHSFQSYDNYYCKREYKKP